MALRWKRNPPETGLRSIGAGPRGHTLRLDGIDVASVNAYGGNWSQKFRGWYWTAGSDAIPYHNSCNDTLCATDAEAKAAAMAYVRQHLKAAATKGA